MGTVNQYDERFVERGFDAVAADYGEVFFLRRAAQALVDVVCQRPLTRALDVCTGPGTSALSLAQRQPACQVVGVDIAPGMIAAAAARGSRAGLSNARFEVASALALPFGADVFDAVFCSSAIYYMADFECALREWKRVLRPGGLLAFSTFGTGVLEPMSQLFDARVRAHGIEVPQPTPLYRLNQASACRALLDAVDLAEVATQERQLGDWVPDQNAWWDLMMSTGFQALVAALDRQARPAFERAHKEEVRPHVTPRGLWLDVPLIVACGIKQV